MSALTKVFVLLLVVLSLVETAGIVVYVNRSQNFAQSLTASRNEVAAAKADATAARDQANLADIARQQSDATGQNQRNLSQQTIESLRAANLEKDAALAASEAKLSQALASQKSANDALVVAQKTLDTQNTQVADLRKQNMELQRRDSENSLALADMNNKFDVVTRQWRDSTEQNAQLQNENKRLNETMHKAGVSLTNPRTLNPESLIRVEGVVQSKQDVGGVPMATISVGSADQVTPGMRFSVIDRSSSDPFLGYITINRVEPNQAIGTLSGPRVNEIRRGAEVRTQL